MAVKTDIELKAENDAALTAPVTAANLKALNIDVIDSKEHKVPTYTTAQRDLISSQAARDLIYNSDTQSYQYWDTVAWREMGAAGNTSGTPAMYSYKITGVAGQSTYTVPLVVISNIDAVRREGNFTELYTPDIGSDTNNFTIDGGAMTDGETIQIFYHAGGALNINGLAVIANTSAARDASPANNYAAGVQAIATNEIDFTITGTYSIPLPSGIKMFVQSVMVELIDAYIVTGQPTVKTGTAAIDNQYDTFTNIGTTDNHYIQTVIGSSNGVTDLQAKVTIAGTAGVMKGRVIFVGVLIQDEV